jgi:hypothetical protein
MGYNEIELRDNVIKKLDSVLNKINKRKTFRFEKNVHDFNERIQSDRYHDIVVYLKDTPLAIFEVKNNAFTNSYNNDLLGNLSTTTIPCRFLIITDGDKIKSFDRFKSTFTDDYEFESLVRLFQTSYTDEEINNLKREFSDSFFDFLKSNNPDEKFTKADIKQQLNIDYYDILENLSFNEKNELSFINVSDSFNHIESRIFDFLLPNIDFKNQKRKSIYRYTTLETLLNILKNKKYRMNGIRGMNDPSDGVFIDKLIMPDFDSDDSEFISTLNNKFISSCTLLGDDLTMWRLYGDNSKGVCLEFEINRDTTATDFFVKQIVYIKKDRENVIDNFVRVFNTFIEKGINFKFKWFDAFKLFFKSDDYNVEKEVRLLYVNYGGKEREWMLANPYNIINPYVEFDLPNVNNELPFKIKKIILGPNCPFKHKNISQVNDLLTQKSFQNVKVELSKIESDTYIA